MDGVIFVKWIAQKGWNDKMGKHLNRLTNEDALKWNKAFKQFCKTEVWNMTKEKITEMDTQKPIKLTKETIKIGTNVPIEIGTHKDLETHNIMADPGHTDRFPESKDWDLEVKIPCANKKCTYHNQSFGKGVCGVLSMMAIDSHGKCTGYKPRKLKKGRNNV